MDSSRIATGVFMADTDGLIYPAYRLWMRQLGPLVELPPETIRFASPEVEAAFMRDVLAKQEKK